MNNKTTYTYDLLAKVNLFQTAKWRRNVLIIFVVELFLGIVLILGDIFVENMYTKTSGVIFLWLALVMFFLLHKNSKGKIRQAVQKLIDENPNKIVEYHFEEDCLVIDVESANVRSTTQLKYSYIKQTGMVDHNTCYWVLKNNVSYVMYDETGVEKYLAQINSKRIA